MARARNSTSKHSSKDAYHLHPPEEENEGKLFRVRDKDWTTVWGVDLTWDAANKLKEQVVTRGKSKTARVESMDVADPRQGTLFAAAVPVTKPSSTVKFSATGKPPGKRNYAPQIQAVKQKPTPAASNPEPEPLVVDGDQTSIDDLLGEGDELDEIISDAQE